MRRAAVVGFAFVLGCGGPTAEEWKALVMLANQGPLCSQAASRILSRWNYSPGLNRDELRAVQAGHEHVKSAIRLLGDPAEERKRAILDLYEAEVRLCNLATNPQGSMLTYGSERMRAEQDFEAKLARTKVVVGPIPEDEVAAWRGEWERSTSTYADVDAQR